MSAKTRIVSEAHSYQSSYKKEKLKTTVLSWLIFICSVSAPISFSFLIQRKVNAIAAFSVGLTFVFSLLFLAYFRSISIRNMENTFNEVRTGMRVKKKQSASSYEVVQETPNFFYLKATHDNKKVVVSRDKLRSDFDLEM